MAKNLQKYTVVLMRPEIDDELKLEDRLYVAVGIEAANCYEAERLSKREAWDADRRDAREQGNNFDNNPSQYIMLCIFDGAHNPAWFGFATGFNQT